MARISQTDDYIGQMTDNFQKLLRAAHELLSSRYSDGEVDTVAMSRFAAVVEEVDPVAVHVGHRLTIDNSDRFKPRRGCLDCNVWIDPVELEDK